MIGLIHAILDLKYVLSVEDFVVEKYTYSKVTFKKYFNQVHEIYNRRHSQISLNRILKIIFTFVMYQ